MTNSCEQLVRRIRVVARTLPRRSRGLTGALAVAWVALGPACAEEPQGEDPSASGAVAVTVEPVADPLGAARAYVATLEGGTAMDRAAVVGLLDAMGVPVESQMLVFSKTSLQNDRITPAHPRAVYFSDEAYVGWVPGGVVELAAFDEEKGTVFEALSVAEGGGVPAWRFEEPGSCLVCHDGPRTRDRPGLMVRSVFPDEAGLPRLAEGSYDTTDASPLSERWGGWYVTGPLDDATHFGNRVFGEGGRAEPVVLALPASVEAGVYPRRTSDPVALMLLEHQCDVHNVLTREAAQVRELARSTRRTAEQLGEATSEAELDAVVAGNATLRAVTDHAADRVVAALVFARAAPLAVPLEAEPAFAEAFARTARRDAAGRSLKDLELGTRLLRYRCSYLIYGRAFGALPDRLKRAVLAKLYAGLSATHAPEGFEHLGDDERHAIAAILRETLDGLPAYWR